MNKADTFKLGIKRIPFNAEMRLAREKKGLSQRELANLVGIGDCSLSQIERMRAYPKEDVARRIAEVLGIELAEVFPKWLQAMQIPYHKRLDVFVDIKPLSLENPEVLMLQAPDNIEEEVDEILLKDSVKEVLGVLSDRERKILELRFGLDTTPGNGEMQRLNGNITSSYGAKTLEEVGREFGVTRDRIRQIEARALRKLKHPNQANKLGKYLFP